MDHHRNAPDFGDNGVRPDSAAIPARPTRMAMAARGVVVVTQAGAYLLASTVSGLVLGALRGRPAGRAHRYRRVRRLLERLGPTYVKFGQIMSGRRDALPGGLCDELSVLHDAVAPMSRRQTRRALAAAYGADLETLFASVDLDPVASGSIAGVYRATLGDGRAVALKLRRPGISTRMATDLALLESGARLAERFPKCQGMPIGDLTGYLCVAILGQLDFEREAKSLEELRSSLSAVAGVGVPALIPEASRPGCLVMEFIEGLDVANVAAQPPEVRRRLATTVMEAASQMLFVDGFVHCDLHPGNLYVTTDAEIVVLDAGFSARVPDQVRALMAEFFLRMSRGEGRRCGEIILASAAEIRPGLDVEGFLDAVAALVATKAGPAVGDFSMMSFGNDLFDLQRDHGLYAKSDFAFPLMSLGIIESTVRTISPSADFQAVGRMQDPEPRSAAS